MTRHRSPRPRRAGKAPSRPHRRDWLQAALVEKIQALAELIALKRAEGAADMASVYQGDRPPAGPAPREGPCEAAANTPSMPR